MPRIIIVFLLLLNTAVQAQFFQIEGTVRDSESKEPLPYVTIALSDNKLGTVTNEQGRFKLLLPDHYEGASLNISYLGYHSQSIVIDRENASISVALKENPTVLEGVTVTGLTAQTIINKVIEKAPQNYYSSPYNSTGFYRLNSTKGKEYVALSEAVFELYQAKPVRKSQFKLTKMRAIKNEAVLENIEIGIKPAAVFKFDVLNNPNEWDILNSRGIKDHVFELEGIVNYEGKDAYVIEFDQRDNLKKAAYKGIIYVDVNSFAVLQMDFGLSPKGLSFYKYGSAAMRALMDLMDIHLEVEKSNYSIRYKPVADIYYLGSVQQKTIFIVRSGRENYNFKMHSDADYIVTSLNTDSVAEFSNKEVLGDNEWIEKQNSMYDPDFWKDYNVILQGDDFEGIARDIAAKNDSHNLRAQIEEQLHRFPKESRIDSILSFYNEKGLFNGNALIASGGKVILKKSYNNEFTSNTEDTQFRIGSTSKTFTSAVVMKLVAEGKLKLDDPVSKYLPWYIHGDITVEQLLTHQSGIPNYLSNPEYQVDIFSNPYELEDLVKNFCSDELEFTPGTAFHYSNSGYAVLALVVQDIQGEAFAEVLSHEIFQPLHMNNSCVDCNSNLRAKGYLYGKEEKAYYSQNVMGAGGVSAITDDLFKWSLAFDNSSFLSKETIDQLWQPRAEYKDWEASYGYGWMIDKHMFKASNKHKIVYHPGTDFGFYSMFLKQPDQGITIILINNTGDFPRFEMTDLILNELN